MTTIDDERAVEYIGEQALAVIERDADGVTRYTPETLTLAADPYAGVSSVPFDEKAQQVLAKYQDVPDEWIDIKPDGKLYLSHIHARNILNEAFGFGGWGTTPVGDFKVERIPFKDKRGNDAEHVIVYRSYRLYAAGRFVDETLSSGNYYTNNPEADYGDACESSKSFAINRLCKTFNIAQKCWNKAFGEVWKGKYAYRDNEGKWKKKPAGDVGKPTAAGQSSNQTSPDVPQSSSPISNQPATSPAKGNTQTIRPTKFDGKSWKMKNGSVCIYLIDSDGDKWTLAGQKLLDEAENAIIDNKLIKVTYTTNGKYRNVQSVEIL